MLEYRHSFARNLPTLMPWAVLLVLLLAVRQNWNPRAWLICIPLACVAGLLSLLECVPLGIGGVATHMSPLVLGIAAGASAVLLLAEQLARLRGAARGFASALVMAALALLMELSLSGPNAFNTYRIHIDLDVFADGAGVSVSLAPAWVSVAIMVAGTVLCAAAIRPAMQRNWPAARLLALCTLCATIVSYVGYAMYEGTSRWNWCRYIYFFEVPLGGLALTLALCLVVWPFLILLLNMRFYRARLGRLLGRV